MSGVACSRFSSGTSSHPHPISLQASGLVGTELAKCAKRCWGWGWVQLAASSGCVKQTPSRRPLTQQAQKTLRPARRSCSATSTRASARWRLRPGGGWMHRIAVTLPGRRIHTPGARQAGTKQTAPAAHLKAGFACSPPQQPRHPGRRRRSPHGRSHRWQGMDR